MKTSFTFFICLCAFFLATPPSTYAQQIKLNGRILSPKGEPLEGAHIYIKDSPYGTVSDKKGEFFLEAELELPQVLEVSMLGYQNYLKDITEENNMGLELNMMELLLFGQEVIVSASRVKEYQIASTSTVEKLNVSQIEEMPAANFYDGLANLKGVDLNTQSITLKNPNTRGFNGTTNFRFNQIIDGVMNTSPGLSFAAGNLLGISAIDLESIELLTGASSALYGAGGMNGTLVMTSKNPYDYQGISASLQTAVMNIGRDEINPNAYWDFNMRYAKQIGKRFAFKLVLSYLTSQDWNALDYRDKTNLKDPGSTRQTNPGYDGVNTFGDEFALDLGLAAPAVADGFAQSQGLVPGTPEYDQAYNTIIDIIPNQFVSRTGYRERDVVNYDARNFKGSLDLAYRFGDDWQATIQGSYASGQAVYSALNRFSLNDFWMTRFKAEIKKGDHFLRYWQVNEDAGMSYDAGAVAALINESWKPSAQWYEDYIGAYVQNRLLGGQDADSHSFARLVADNRDSRGNIQDPSKPSIPLPGSPEFQTEYDRLIRLPVSEGGARVLDYSSMGQLEGMYNFNELFTSDIDLVVGFQWRNYTIDSNGSIYADTPEEPIRQYEWGAYAQYIDRFLKDRLKFNLSVRYDKNEYFDGEVTPRLSLVYRMGKKSDNYLRASIQSAFRFPANQDQWTDLNVGGTRTIGGQQRILEKYELTTKPVYPLVGTNPILAVPDTSNGQFIFPKFRSERVYSLELGYKSMLLDQKMMLDANIYYSQYNGFHATRFLVREPYTANEERFQTVISTDSPVNTWGWSLGLDYQFYSTYYFGGNLTFDTINDDFEDDSGFQNQFNTPKYRFNIYTGNRFINKFMGFQVNYRWQDSFVWQSTFGVGEIDAYGTLDAQVNFRIDSWNTKVKVGASNMLNQYYISSLGSAQVGGMYYVTLTYQP